MYLYKVIKQTPIFFLIIFSIGCSKSVFDGGEPIKTRFINLLSEAISQKKDKVNLNLVVEGEWRKICIIAPYTLEIGFEKDTNEKVEGYKSVNDDNYNALWIFYNSGAYQAVQIPRVMGAPQEGRSSCTSSKNPWIYISSNNQQNEFFFSEKEGI